MEPPSLEEIIQQVREALERNDLKEAARIIEAYHPADKAELFAELDLDQQVALLPRLAPGESAGILAELDEAQAAELVETLTDETVIRIVDEMDPDEAADLLGDIEPDRVETVLSGIEDAEEVRPLLIHPDETAGGLMTSDYMALRRKMTCQDAIEAVRSWSPDSETIYYLFVVDRLGKLVGVVNLRQLIVSEPSTRIEEVMNPDVISVGNDNDQEETARVMARYDLLALPVVNQDQTLLGVVTFDDVMDVLEEEATEDIQRLGGAEPLDRSYLDTHPLTITRKRIGWLLILFVTATLTGSVIRLFEEQVEAVVALVIFIPLLIGTGGNAGSQTTATIIRSLATGDIIPQEVFKVWWHEARIGLLLGLGMGMMAYLRAITWDPDPLLAITVAVSTVGLVLWATGVGAILPLAACRVGLDPALVSGPLMSTLVDATGLFIYFSIARLILGI